MGSPEKQTNKIAQSIIYLSVCLSIYPSIIYCKELAHENIKVKVGKLETQESQWKSFSLCLKAGDQWPSTNAIRQRVRILSRECSVSRIRLCDPVDCSPQAPLSMGLCQENIGVGCHALLQGIFLTQGSNPCLLWFLHYSWEIPWTEEAGGLQSTGLQESQLDMTEWLNKNSFSLSLYSTQAFKRPTHKGEGNQFLFSLLIQC